MKQFLIAGMLASVLVGCSSHKVDNVSGREPNQWNDNRWGSNNNDRRDDRRDNRWGNDRRDDRRDGGYGHSNWRMRDNVRCIGCFDRTRWNDGVKLGSEMTLWGDQNRRSSFSETQEAQVWGFYNRENCGIRSISLEVLRNEALILGLEVKYSGSWTWDRIPVQKDWEFRNGTREGEQSIWFDVGADRWNDSVCIDRVRVIGYTLKDNYYDFESATVQVWGSRTRRGVSDHGPGPGWNNGPGPGPVVIVTPPPRPTRKVDIPVPQNKSCLANIIPQGQPRDGKAVAKWAKKCDENNPARDAMRSKMNCRVKTIVIDHAAVIRLNEWKTSGFRSNQQTDVNEAFSDRIYTCEEYY